MGLIKEDIRVSIVIVNYNTLALTLQCIESIYAQVKSIQFEIIVVDNASFKNELKEIKKQYPKVVCVQSDENLGFGRANNMGIEHAQGDYLFLLNSDTILLNDPFLYFVEFISCRTSVNIGVLGAFLLDEAGGRTLSGGDVYSKRSMIYNAFLRYFGSVRKDEVNWNCEHYTNVGYVIGADMFISKKVFEKLGGFDKKIFMYFEDVELCKRSNKMGLQSFLIKGPKIIHLVGKRKTSQFMRIYNIASLMYCLQKEENKILFWLFQVLLFFLRLPFLFDSRFSLKENWLFLIAIFDYKKYLLHE